MKDKQKYKTSIRYTEHKIYISQPKKRINISFTINNYMRHIIDSNLYITPLLS